MIQSFKRLLTLRVLHLGWVLASAGLLAMGPVNAAAPAVAKSMAQVQLLDKAQASQLLRADRYKRPTLVVLWSTECSYCKRNLQWLKALSADKSRFDLISVATEPMSPAVSKVLAQHKLNGQHWAYGSELPEAVAYALDADWAGELPRSYWFDGQGGRQVLSGVLTDGTMLSVSKKQDTKVQR